MFNLSILTSDMWAVVIRIFFYKQEVFISKLCLILLSCYIDGLNPSFLSLMHVYEVLQLFQANASHLFTICVNRMKPDLILIPPLQVDWLYYLAFAIVVVGLILYSTTYVLNLCLNYFLLVKLSGCEYPCSIMCKFLSLVSLNRELKGLLSSQN